jgi:hypothetical protein
MLNILHEMYKNVQKWLDSNQIIKTTDLFRKFNNDGIKWTEMKF